MGRTILTQNFMKKTALTELIGLPTYVAARSIKPYITGHPRSTEKPNKLKLSIEKILAEQGVKGYKVSTGKTIPEKQEVMKAFHFDLLGKLVGNQKANKIFDKMMTGRDWTLNEPRVLHVGTNDPDAAAHEIGHAIQYYRYPKASKVLFGVAEGLSAAPSTMMALSFIPKFRQAKVFKPFKKRPFLASILFSLPLLGRETYANIKAMQLAEPGERKKRFFKKVLPLQAAYTAVALSPAILTTLLRKRFFP